MRTRLIDPEGGGEVVVDLARAVRRPGGILEFRYLTPGGPRTVRVRRLAGDLFASLDGTRWRRLPRGRGLLTRFVNADRAYDVHRGYRPSGLVGPPDGALVTKMPGKVVKILVKPGDRVETGGTLLVLEAMKMENEIKAHAGGIVRAVHVAEGDVLEAGVLMAEIGG